MTEINFFSAFLIGLAGGVHCLGMCGGIVGALRAVMPAGHSSLPYALSYNTGRIVSYTLAGAITGGIGGIATQHLPIGPQLLAMLSALMLLALALYLGQWWTGLTRLERFGQHIWKHIQPYTKKLLPLKNPLQALPYGALWGWLPCGLVYSTLTWSLASGSAREGALIMLGFGLGTLPTLLAANASAGWLMNMMRQPKVRQLVAITLLIYAVFLIYNVVSSIK